MSTNQESRRWEIVDFSFKKQINKLPIQCKKKYAVFKHISNFSGLAGLSNSPGFKLEKLKGAYKDYYSIRLNISYRVIFKTNVLKRKITIKEISNHEYKTEK